MIRPPVVVFVVVFGFLAAELRRCGSVAFRVLKEPRVSISITVLKAFAERLEIGARKLPAAPALRYV